MSVLSQMYQAAILEQSRRRSHRGMLDPADVVQEGVNPSCGDELTLSLRFDDGRIGQARFDGHGCAISQASASLMAQAIEGRNREEAEALIAHVRDMVHGRGLHPDLGELAVLQGVQKLPARVKCATLAWTTLEQALKRAPAGGEQQAD